MQELGQNTTQRKQGGKHKANNMSKADSLSKIKPYL